MSQIGFRVLLRSFAGNEESVAAFNAGAGKEIAALSLGDDDALHFTFTDGTKMKFFDDGQSCCESRYMRTDDDLTHFVGSTLLDAETRDAPCVEDECGESHDIQFLVITTSKGDLTMSSHNEHNGYYGGFYIVAATE